MMHNTAQQSQIELNWKNYIFWIKNPNDDEFENQTLVLLHSMDCSALCVVDL